MSAVLGHLEIFWFGAIIILLVLLWILVFQANTVQNKLHLQSSVDFLVHDFCRSMGGLHFSWRYMWKFWIISDRLDEDSIGILGVEKVSKNTHLAGTFPILPHHVLGVWASALK